MINNIISCEFNIDTACVEVKLTDGSMVSIDCIAVENEYANNMYETSELDYLIYNEPMSYVRLLYFPGKSTGVGFRCLLRCCSRQR